MDDFDILYMLKTPLYLGSYSKVKDEADQAEINQDDLLNLQRKNLLVVRALTAKNDFAGLKEYLQKLLEQDPTKKDEVQGFSYFVQYIAQKKVDQNLMNGLIDMMEKEPAKLKENYTVYTLLAYYLYIEEDFNKLLMLLHKTKDLEFLTLTVITYLRLNRIDLAEQTLNIMKKQDEDNILTVLSHCWVAMHKSGTNSHLDGLIGTLNQLSERFGYTTKTYNLLAMILMQKNDFDRALKIFENAITELDLDGQGAAEHLVASNTDLGCLIFNYIKCHTAKNGHGQGVEFLKGNELNKKLFGYLVTMKSSLGRAFFEELQSAEKKFDEALAQFSS